MSRHSFSPAPEGKDAELWNQAQLRAAFKTSLASYLVVNTMLIGIWAVTSYTSGRNFHFWPIWPILGWGVGLVFQYLHAYQRSNLFSVDKEYDRLKQTQEDRP